MAIIVKHSGNAAPQLWGAFGSGQGKRYSEDSRLALERAEREKSRQAAMTEAERSRRFRAKQSEKEMEFQAGEREKSRLFSAAQSERDFDRRRDFADEEFGRRKGGRRLRGV